MHSKPARSRRFDCPMAAVLAAATWICTPAASGAEAEAGIEELAEVQVTGSRIRQNQDYVSPNPVQTFNAEQLDRLGIVNISDAVNQVPVNVSSFQSRNQGGNPFFVGSTLANLRGLNPYFGTRTLTLVGSRRFVPTNQGQSVDLNFVPSVLVERIEVVTGGASAAYGSDAVTGVVNILLDERLQGFRTEVDYGLTQRGDGDNYHVGVAAGTGLLADRARVVFGLEHQKSSSIDDCAAARRWCERSNGYLLNGGSGFEAAGAPYTPLLNPGWPQRVRAADLRVNQANAYGVIFNGTAGATTAITTNASGTGLADFSIGQYGTVSPTQTVIGGDGVPTTSITSLYPDVRRTAAYGRFTYDVTDTTRAFAEASFGDVDAFVTQGGPGFVITSRCVADDNAYLTGALADAVAAAQGNDNRLFGGCAADTTLVRKDWYSQIDRNVTTDTRVYRAVAGLEGSFGASSWTWDGYYQFGRTSRAQVLRDNNTSKRMDMALDAVFDDAGQIVCRVTRDGVQPEPPAFPGGPSGGIDPAREALAEGCVPLNLFGNQPLTQAQRDYAFGDLVEKNVIRQHVLAVNVSGQLWRGWGYGPLAAAAGVEYRREKLTNEAADLPFYQRTDFAAQYSDPFGGTTQVGEAYVEFEMPLLGGVPLARDLRLNLAARHTKYRTEDDLVPTNPDTKVSVTTWKVAGLWDPVQWLRLRGSHSRDLRAAGFRELYYSQSIPADPPGTPFGFGGVTNEWRAAPGNFDPSVNILSGNSGLKPEKATTTTAGFVLSPGGRAQGMHFSLDWYRIRLVNGISGGLLQNTVHRCWEGDAFYCSLIEGTPGDASTTTAGPDGSFGFADITQVRAPYENGRPYLAEGLDITWNHRLELSGLFASAAGSLLVSASATRALKTELQYLQYPNYETRNVVGQVGSAGFLADYAPTPKWVGNLAVSYEQGPTTMTLQSQWTGAGKMNNELPWSGPGDAGYDPALAGSVDDNTVGDYFTFNLIGSRDLEISGLKAAEVFLSVTNLFDRDPPFSNGGIGGVNGVFYDTLGRSFRLGLRVRF